jgi:hypothetical protein
MLPVADPIVGGDYDEGLAFLAIQLYKGPSAESMGSDPHPHSSCAMTVDVPPDL